MSSPLNNIYNNISYALNQHAMAMAKLQEQVTSGSRVNRASDDPTGAYQILGLNSQQKSLDNYIENISSASDILNLSNTVIQNIKSSLSEVKSAISQVTSGTYSEDARQRTAEQVNQILEQAVLLANTKNMNQYLFGGSSSGTAPYAVERTNGKITSVVYQGASEQRSIEVGPGVQMEIFPAGNQIFLFGRPGRAGLFRSNRRKGRCGDIERSGRCVADGNQRRQQL